MSLSASQKKATIQEFQQNIELLGYSLEKIALELDSTPAYLNKILHLETGVIEEPWILRNYLLEKLAQENKIAIPFTALKGAAEDYWFLDIDKIKRGITK